jgi:hypothetical protein
LKRLNSSDEGKQKNTVMTDERLEALVINKYLVKEKHDRYLNFIKSDSTKMSTGNSEPGINNNTVQPGINNPE